MACGATIHAKPSLNPANIGRISDVMSLLDQVDALISDTDAVAAKVAAHFPPLLDLLAGQRGALPPRARDKAEADITALRAGRVLHFLRSARMLAKAGLGSALALVARATWETWFDTAWMLHDPAKRYERANAVWVAGLGQQAGLIDAYLKWDGHLEPHLQAARDEITSFVKAEPGLYADWFNVDGSLRRSVHSIRSIQRNAKARAQDLDAAAQHPLYERAYDLEYTLLSRASHGEGTPLLRLMQQTDGEPIRVEAGEGKDAAANYFILVCGCALFFVYEVQRAHLRGGHHKDLGRVGDEITALRSRCPSWL